MQRTGVRMAQRHRRPIVTQRLRVGEQAPGVIPRQSEIIRSLRLLPGRTIVLRDNTGQWAGLI